MSCQSLVVPVTPRPRHLVFALLLALAGSPAWATTVPQTVQLTNGLNTGGTSFMDGFGSTDPGWVLVQYARYSQLDAIKDAHGDDVSAFSDPKISTTLLLTQFAYVSRQSLFGGVLGFNTLVPLVDLHASFGSSSLARLSDNGFGLGDVTFGPFLQMKPVIRDGRPVFSQRFELDAIAPVGKFDSSLDLNQSSGYWSLVPSWAMTVLPTPQWEISARLNYVYNFRGERAADVTQLDGFTFRNGQAGDAAWVNFTTSYALTPALRLGVNGYYLSQLRDNRTNGIGVADTKQRLFYLGPGTAWQLDARNILNVNLYLPVEVRNAASGNNLNLMYVHVF